MAGRRENKGKRAAAAAGRKAELPADHRHAYVQLVDGSSLVEKDLRAEAHHPEEGRVLEAAYMEERGIFERIFQIFNGSSPMATLSLAPPFDAEGEDVLGLFAASADVHSIEPREAAIGQVRRVCGRVVPLGPEVAMGGAVLRDFWLERTPALHACEAVDLVVCPEGGPPVVLSFDLSPLVVGKPSRASFSGFMSRVGPRMRALLRSMKTRRPRREEGKLVEMLAGQTIEALFVVRAEARSAHELSINGEMRVLPSELAQVEGGPYRGGSDGRVILGGDAPGTRAVLRILR